jgi:quercetin dioxygenase-like cupin family protein
MFRKLTSALVIGGAVAVGYVGGAFATPGSGFTGVDMSKGRFEEFQVEAGNPEGNWVRLETRGPSDFYVVENTVTPGGYSGWHTHPGPSLVTVKSGTATFFDGDDTTCNPRVYVEGNGFIDRGDGHVHMVRNDGDVDLVLVTIQLFPADIAPRRVDALDPGHCAM